MCFSENSEMGDFELVNFRRELEEDGGENERFITMASWFFEGVLRSNKFGLTGEEWMA